MKVDEAEAILSYLEFNLLKMIEQIEPGIDNLEVRYDLHDQAYALLADLQITLDSQLMLQEAVEYHNSQKP